MQMMFRFLFLVVLLAPLAAAQAATTKYWVELGQDTAEIHVTAKLAENNISALLLEAKGVAEPPLLMKLNDVDGVTEVFITEYSVRVRKGAAFLWEEILPNVLKIVSEHVGGKLKERKPPPPPSPCPEPLAQPGNKA